MSIIFWVLITLSLGSETALSYPVNSVDLTQNKESSRRFFSMWNQESESESEDYEDYEWDWDSFLDFVQAGNGVLDAATGVLSVGTDILTATGDLIGDLGGFFGRRR